MSPNAFSDYSLYDDLFSDSPDMYFSTAAGPAEDDIYGPPSDVLSIYGDGSPMLHAEQMMSNNVYRGTGGRHAHWWQRGDVHALAITIIGYWMLKQYMKD